jgi:hypothetical protein
MRGPDMTDRDPLSQVITAFHQEDGPVTASAFRDDGQAAVLVTGTPTGAAARCTGASV